MRAPRIVAASLSRLSSSLALAFLAGAALAQHTDARAQAGAVRGIVVERYRLPRAPEVEIGDRIATIVRVDPRRYAFRFLTESHEGERRPADRWMRDFRLAGVVNAGMFLPSGRSCGYLRQRGEVRSDRSPPGWDSMIGFDPSGPFAPFEVGGTGCARDLDAMRAAFGSVLQGRRMLVDCAGRARTDWRTGRFSSVLLGADRDGRAVMVHTRTPYRMQILAEMLAAPELGLRGLTYMEGGPEASLLIEAEGERVREIGSYEDGFWPRDDNRRFWDLPNVVGFAAR